MLALRVYRLRYQQADVFDEILGEVQRVIEKAVRFYCYAPVEKDKKKAAAIEGVWKAVEGYDPWKGWGKRPPLFSMDGSCGLDLNNGRIPRRVFSQEGYQLSDHACVHVKTRDVQWEIWDENSVYLVTRAGSQLRVYLGTSLWGYVKLRVREQVRELVRECFSGSEPEDVLQQILERRLQDITPPDLSQESEAEGHRGAENLGEWVNRIWGTPRKVESINDWLDMLPADARDPLQEALRDMARRCIREHIVPWLKQREPELLYLGYYLPDATDRERAEAISRDLGRHYTHDAYRQWHSRFGRKREAHWAWRRLDGTQKNRIWQDVQGFAKREHRAPDGLNASQKREWAEEALGKGLFPRDLHREAIVGVLDHILKDVMSHVEDDATRCILCEMEEEFQKRCRLGLKSIGELFGC